jgi:hypothetical protein
LRQPGDNLPTSELGAADTFPGGVRLIALERRLSADHARDLLNVLAGVSGR